MYLVKYTLEKIMSKNELFCFLESWRLYSNFLKYNNNNKSIIELFKSEEEVKSSDIDWHHFCSGKSVVFNFICSLI